MSEEKLKEHIEALQRAGYTVKKPKSGAKVHSFLCTESILKRFLTEAKTRKKTMRQAIDEAMVLWLKK